MEFALGTYHRVNGHKFVSWRQLGPLAEIALRVMTIIEPRWKNVQDRVFPAQVNGTTRRLFSSIDRPPVATIPSVARCISLPFDLYTLSHSVGRALHFIKIIMPCRLMGTRG